MRLIIRISINNIYLVEELQKTVFDKVVRSRSISISDNKGSSTTGSGTEFLKDTNVYITCWHG
jgi:hypothetical protein